jgi:hypothetical protein
VQNSHRVLVGSDHARPPCHRRHPHAALQSSLGSGHAK